MIKKLLISLLFIVFVSLQATTVFAHLVGQPPFLKINGSYANLYPVPVSSFYDFNLPQDIGPSNYLINQTINLELDKIKLPAPQDIVEKTKFTWDFGDGGQGTGLINNHRYTKIGSYIVDIYADDGTIPQSQLLEKVLINILPNQDYKLPQSKILLNGKETNDSLIDILQFSFKNPLQFDGSSSTGKISSYSWDFGDQKSASGVSVSHQYAKDLTQAFVVLRIKDSNGFIADSFIEVQNSDLKGESVLFNLGKSGQLNKSDTPSQLKYSLIVLGVLIGIFLIKKFYLKR